MYTRDSYKTKDRWEEAIISSIIAAAYRNGIDAVEIRKQTVHAYAKKKK